MKSKLRPQLTSGGLSSVDDEGRTCATHGLFCLRRRCSYQQNAITSHFGPRCPGKQYPSPSLPASTPPVQGVLQKTEIAFMIRFDCNLKISELHMQQHIAPSVHKHETRKKRVLECESLTESSQIEEVERCRQTKSQKNTHLILLNPPVKRLYLLRVRQSTCYAYANRSDHHGDRASVTCHLCCASTRKTRQSSLSGASSLLSTRRSQAWSSTRTQIPETGCSCCNLTPEMTRLRGSARRHKLCTQPSLLVRSATLRSGGKSCYPRVADTLRLRTRHTRWIPRGRQQCRAGTFHTLLRQEERQSFRRGKGDSRLGYTRQRSCCMCPAGMRAAVRSRSQRGSSSPHHSCLSMWMCRDPHSRRSAPHYKETARWSC
eukprot:6173105-Pleurochrysis_carterae.AAC.1